MIILVYLKNKNLLKVYSYIHLIGRRIANEYSKQEIRCPTHLSIGQEVVLQYYLFITKNDLCVSTHRSMLIYCKDNSFISELYGKALDAQVKSMHLIDQKGFRAPQLLLGTAFQSIKIKLNIAFLGMGRLKRCFLQSLICKCKKIPIYHL